MRINSSAATSVGNAGVHERLAELISRGTAPHGTGSPAVWGGEQAGQRPRQAVGWQQRAKHRTWMVLHSATKYLGGHGDVVAGVIACGQEQAAALRRVRAVTGGLLHPLGAYLLHRGLATLPIRVRAQQANAQRIAEWLTTHSYAERVHYPGIEGDPHGLLGSQMKGTGAMISIDLHGGYAQAVHVTSAVGLFTHAVSLGGVDSLIQHPAALTHRPVAPEARPAASLVRLSIGLEDSEDLMADLDQALATHRPIAVPAGASRA